jgi:hypothetical protein
LTELPVDECDAVTGYKLEDDAAMLIRSMTLRDSIWRGQQAASRQRNPEMRELIKRAAK